jgi:hypothetical protein
MSKAKIPRALREQLWLERVGKKFESKCKTTWCKNKMTVFDFQCGHDIPESKGGETNLQNLVPICSRCNLSMSNTYTFKEWNAISVKSGIWKNLETLVTRLFGTKASGTKSKPKPTNPKSKPSQSHGKR